MLGNAGDIRKTHDRLLLNNQLISLFQLVLTIFGISETFGKSTQQQKLGRSIKVVNLYLNKINIQTLLPSNI